MTEVLLDGPCAGMTTEEYEKMRADDCEIAQHLGWTHAIDDGAVYWRNPIDQQLYLRDEERGVWFFGLDMNGAYNILSHVAHKWRYAARDIFYGNLQKLGSFDESRQSCPEGLHVLTTLVDTLPESICKAFLQSTRFFESANFSPYEAPTSSAVEIVENTITDDEGNERKVPGVKLTGKPPWVHTD